MDNSNFGSRTRLKVSAVALSNEICQLGCTILAFENALQSGLRWDRCNSRTAVG